MDPILMRKLFLILGLLLGTSLRAHATITFSQAKGNAACGNVGSCTVTGFTAIAAGSFLIARMGSSATTLPASAGSSNAGTWVVPAACATNADCHEADTTGGSVAVQYILSTTGTPTSIICTAATGSMTDCAVSVYTFTSSPMSFDVGAVRDQTTAATSFAGTSAGTLTGTNDVIIQYGVTNGTFSACPNSGAAPADFTNGNSLCGSINSTNNAAGAWTLSGSGRAALGAIAFKEAAAGSGCPKTRSRMGVGC
jgi:hypothetical protein